MTAFTTRVVLHGADWSEYDDLHEEMEQRGFTRTIKSGDGIVYELPDAEYNRIADVTRDDVLESAKAAAKAAAPKRKHSVLVTQANGRTWYNLKKA